MSTAQESDPPPPTAAAARRKSGAPTARFRFRTFLLCVVGIAIVAMAALNVRGFALASSSLAAAPTVAAQSPAMVQAHGSPGSSSESFLGSLSDDERAWLREHPVIRVAQDPSWPPIEFATEGGAPSGMTHDYLTSIEQRLGLKFERVVNLSWQEAYARMKRWEVDMTTTVTTTAERETFWAFTKPYMTIPIVIVTRADMTYVGDLRELEGTRVAVVDGYVSNDLIARDYPGIQLVRVRTTQEALAMLERGEVVACVENMLVVSHYLAELQMTSLKISGSSPYVNAQRMAVRKDWAPLAGILDKALDSIPQAERNAIYRKWLPIRYDYGFDNRRLWPVAALVAVALLGLAAWNWKHSDKSRGPLPGGGQLKTWQAYLFAVSATIATFGLRFALDSRLGENPTLVIFTLPIMLSAYVGGLRAGLLATALAFFGASYFLLSPINSFEVSSHVERWQQFFLALTGVLISGLSEVLHRARWQADLAMRERRQVEASNERALQRLTEAQRIGQIGDWEFDLATGSITWSPQTFEILGRDPGLGPPRSYEENAAIYEAASSALMSEKVAAAIASGEPQEYELVAIRPDGQRVSVQAMAVPRKDKTGKVVGLAGTVQDVSARRRAERLVRESEERLSFATEAAQIGDWDMDLRTNVARRSLLHDQCFGYTEMLPAWSYDTFLAHIQPADRDRVDAGFRKAMAGEGDYDEEFRAPWPDGSEHWLWTKGRFYFDEAGQPYRVAGIVVDISQRKQAEGEVAQLNAELEQRVTERTAQLEAANKELETSSLAVTRDLRVAEAADQIKSAFLATMSHELRTPLNSILGFSGILLQELAGPLNPEQAKQLGMVRGSARHLLELINDVLDISKIEAGQFNVYCEPFDLPASIERAIALVKPLAHKKGLVLTAVVDPAIGELVSDRLRVEQILINLLSNAIKFTVRGSITLTVETIADFQGSPDAAPVSGVSLRVSDTGIGIKREDMAMLFEPFRQIDSGLARQSEGTGLGLAISRRLATLLGGEIRADSVWSKGSEFTVILPLVGSTAP